MKTISTIHLTGAVSAMLMLFASQASAAPSAEPKCSRNVNVVEGTQGVMFDDNCSTAFVLPPVEGAARTSAVATNLNLNFCPGVLRIGGVVSRSIEAQDVIAGKILQMIEDFDPLDEELQELKAELAQSTAEQTAAEATLTQNLGTKAELVAAIADAKSTYDTCVLLNDAASCSDPLAAWNAAKLEFKNFVVDTLTPSQKAVVAAKAKHDALFDEYTGKTTQVANALLPLFALQGQLADLSASIMGTYDTYTRMTGVTAQLTYSIPWDTIIHKYQVANPGINFQRLPIKSANFNASVNPVLTGAGGAIPTILGFSIPGMSGSGANFFPTGEGAIPPLSNSTPAPDLGPQYLSFGTSVSSQIVMSLLGSCQFYPTGVSGPSVGDLNHLTANMAANLTYSYEVKAHRGYTARYNLSQFVSRLETVKKKGGFFSSKTLRDIQEDANSSDWFNITFDQTAGGFSYSPQEKINIAREARGQLMERALKLLAVQMGTLSGNPGTPAPLAPTGAGVAAAYLQEGCGFNIWCQAGGWVLGTLDSIFGRKESVLNFKRNNNVWVTDRVDDATILERSGGLSFTKPL